MRSNEIIMFRCLTIILAMLCAQVLSAQYYFNPQKIITGGAPFLADYTQLPVTYTVVDSSAYDSIVGWDYPAHIASLTEAFDTAGNIVFWSNGLSVSTFYSPYMKGGDTLNN